MKSSNPITALGRGKSNLLRGVPFINRTRPASPVSRRRSSSKGGFTAVELLVVLAIIAVLVGLAAKAYGNLNARARLTAAQDEQNLLQQQFADWAGAGGTMTYGADVGQNATAFLNLMNQAADTSTTQTQGTASAKDSGNSSGVRLTNQTTISYQATPSPTLTGFNNVVYNTTTPAAALTNGSLFSTCTTPACEVISGNNTFLVTLSAAGTIQVGIIF